MQALTLAQQKLVEQCLPLVHDIANKLAAQHGVDKDDLAQIGVLAAMRVVALPWFDIGKKAAIVYRAVRGDIVDHLRSDRGPIHIPRSTWEDPNCKYKEDAERAARCELWGELPRREMARPDEDWTRARDLLARFPWDVRSVVELRMEGYTDKEINGVLRPGEGTVADYIAEAGRILAGILAAENMGESPVKSPKHVAGDEEDIPPPRHKVRKPDPLPATPRPRPARKQVQYHGETHYLRDLIARSPLDDRVVRRRLEKGWSADDALDVPHGGRRKAKPLPATSPPVRAKPRSRYPINRRRWDDLAKTFVSDAM